jgi:4-diphosphocytidyl-2-C-methyl-D-erythritol kinase
MKLLKLKSYAKINLSLNITGKLSSKLHKIESLVSFINLYDILHIRKINRKKHKIFFRGKFAKGINKKNTISELLKALDSQNLLKNQKFEIRIIKNIPHKSGLGGGSMNAASIIDCFLRKKVFRLRKEKINDLSKSIGSDVILGIKPKNTVLSSNGKLTKFKKNINYHLLVVKPNFGCSTALIYSKVKHLSKSKYNLPKLSLFNKYNIKNSKNELEQVAFKLYPKLRKIKFFLLELSNIIFARMSGSGSSIIAYFHSKRDADIAAKKFKRKFKSYWCITSKTI